MEDIAALLESADHMCVVGRRIVADMLRQGKTKAQIYPHLRAQLKLCLNPELNSCSIYSAAIAERDLATMSLKSLCNMFPFITREDIKLRQDLIRQRVNETARLAYESYSAHEDERAAVAPESNDVINQAAAVYGGARSSEKRSSKRLKTSHDEVDGDEDARLPPPELSKCVICMNRTARIAPVPCGHLVLWLKRLLRAYMSI